MSIDSDERYTPEWVLNTVREFTGGPIALDAATTSQNPTKATRFYTKHSNGLALEWSTWVPNPSIVVPAVWVNPPYSRGQIAKWLTKCIEQARSGIEILCLLPADVTKSWFDLACRNADVRCLLKRRVGFVSPNGEQLPGAKFGSALWYWGRHRRRFRRVFGGDFGRCDDMPGPEEVLSGDA